MAKVVEPMFRVFWRYENVYSQARSFLSNEEAESLWDRVTKDKQIAWAEMSVRVVDDSAVSWRRVREHARMNGKRTAQEPKK